MKPDPLKKLQQIATSRRVSPKQRARFATLVSEHLVANSSHISSPNFSQISDGDLGTLFQLIDELYLEGWLTRAYEIVAANPLAFRLSTRMTRSGGTTTMFRSGGRNPKLEFEIAIATTPLFETFSSKSNGDNLPCVVGGVQCHNRVEALQRIMEHEMIHLTEMLLTGDSNCSAHPFKGIVRRLFGHTESNHQLLTPSDIARRQLGIRAGDQVVFSHRGKQVQGTVNRITKRATVLVPDPSGTTYSDGKKYATFYVPLRRLRKAG